jgi:hypothetical protein
MVLSEIPRNNFLKSMSVTVPRLAEASWNQRFVTCYTSAEHEQNVTGRTRENIAVRLRWSH